MKTFSFVAALCLLSVGFVFAQELPVPLQPPEMSGRISPTQLLRIRSQLTRDIQESQRILGFIDPADTQLVALHKEQQAELLSQLKEINEQLKAQGFPTGNEVAPAEEPTLPPRPRAEDPTLVPGGTPRAPADPNLLVQRRGETPPNFGAVMPGATNIDALPPELRAVLEQSRQPELSSVATPGMPISTPPTAFDQDQAWSESPWAVQPSKELTSVKESVESLRKEVVELKETVKDLEAQIRLLNRLLSQQNTQQ